MRILSTITALATLALTACSTGTLSKNVRTLAIDTTPERPVQILAPADSRYFQQTAKQQESWLQGRLRSSIQEDLRNSQRFTTARGNGGDAVISFVVIRHGLVEVTADNYAATLNAEVIIRDNAGKTLAQRTLNATSGMLHTLEQFEDSRVYQESLGAAADKLALELVGSL